MNIFEMSGNWNGVCVCDLVKQEVRGFVIKRSFPGNTFNNNLHASSHMGYIQISKRYFKNKIQNSHSQRFGLEDNFLLLQKAVQSSLGIPGMK